MSDRNDDINDVSDDPDAAAAAVASTRSRMRQTLSSLGERVAPGRLIETAKAALLDGDHEVAVTVVGFIRRHPIPIVLSTAGLAWLGVSIVRDGIADDKADASGVLPPPEDDMHGMPYGGTPTTRIATDRGAALVGGAGQRSPVAQGSTAGRGSSAGRGSASVPHGLPIGEPSRRVQASAFDDGVVQHDGVIEIGDDDEDVGGDVMASARKVRRRAADMADQAHDAVRRQATLAREGIAAGAEEVSSVMERATASVKKTFSDHPVLFGVAGLALGALVGIVIPRTRREDLMIGDQSDAFARRAKAEARDLVERGKVVVREGWEAAKEELDELAGDAKAHGRALLEDAKDAARQTGDEVIEAAEEQLRQKKRDFPQADATVDYIGRAPGQTNRDAEGQVQSRLSASELFGASTGARGPTPPAPPTSPLAPGHAPASGRAASPPPAPLKTARKSSDGGHEPSI